MFSVHCIISKDNKVNSILESNQTYNTSRLDKFANTRSGSSATLLFARFLETENEDNVPVWCLLKLIGVLLTTDLAIVLAFDLCYNLSPCV